MASEKSRNPEMADTTRWDGGVAAPRIPDDAGTVIPADQPGSPETKSPSETVETEVFPPPEINAEDAPARRAATDAAASPSSSPRREPLPMILERIAPSIGRGERIHLDGDHRRLRVGRADSNELRLYTASTSREHGTIEGNEAGDWVFIPLPGRSVSVDGSETSDPVILEAGMNLVLGGDQLRCRSEAELAAEGPTAAEGLTSETPIWANLRMSRGLLWSGIVVLVFIGLFLWFRV